MKRPSVVDLFCGCGGFSVGFQNAGFEIAVGVDINAVALQTFARNFPRATTVQADLTKYSPNKLLRELGLEPGSVDCLVGGPPCQGFSKNVPASQRWLEDPKNQLMLRFLDFVATARPTFAVIENVAEMMNAYGEAYTSEILHALDRLGYKARKGTLLAADFGVPQLRRRAFFVASRIEKPLAFPEPTHLPRRGKSSLFGKQLADEYISVWEAISDLPGLEAGEGSSPCDYMKEPETEYQALMRSGSGLLFDHVARPLRKTQLERVKHLEPGKGEGYKSLPIHLRPRNGYSGAYGRLIPNEPARTITRWVFHPGSGRYYHPFDNRVITIREAGRLQSFPDWFVFEGSYIQKSHQVGEAVPPLLAQAFAEKVHSLLSAHGSPSRHKR